MDATVGGDQVIDARREGLGQQWTKKNSVDADTLAVEQTLRGEHEAFGRIVGKYTPIFYGLIKRMQHDWPEESIEDGLQEIFLQIYRALPTFRQGNPFFSWAYTIAMNWVRSQLRKTKSAHIFANVPYDEENGVLQGHRNTDAPLESLMASEAELLLEEAVQSLRPKYREVFVLRMMQGLSVAETAKVLGIPEGTVKTFLYRGQQQLRAWLKGRGWSPKD